MVIICRSGWVYTALVRMLGALPALEQGRPSDAATFALLRAILIGHGCDHTTMAELLSVACGNVLLMLRDPAIATLKEEKPESLPPTSRLLPKLHRTKSWIRFGFHCARPTPVNQPLESVVAHDKQLWRPQP